MMRAGEIKMKNVLFTVVAALLAVNGFAREFVSKTINGVALPAIPKKLAFDGQKT